MKKFRKLFLVLFFPIIISTNCCNGNKEKNTAGSEDKTGDFYIGWASADITPDKPVLMRGLFRARVSEVVKDPITATVLAIESGEGTSSEKAIMISLDLIAICDGLKNNVRKLLKEKIPELRPEQVILNATHTHNAPECSSDSSSKNKFGIELDVMTPVAYSNFVSDKIAKAVEKAWNRRTPGGISYGLGHAVASHNRLWSDFSGKTTKRGNTNSADFSHIEGYEDHSVNLLYTWNKEKNLKGVVINLASPAQVGPYDHQISSDYWHDVRAEVRQQLGDDIFILPQSSAAGDQAPHVLVEKKAEERMQRIIFPDVDKTGNDSRGRREQVALRIVEAVTSVFPYMKDNIEWNPEFGHQMEQVKLSRRLLSKEDVNNALKESEKWKKQYEQLLREIEENPEIKDEERWYTDVTSAYRRMKRGESVKERYELEKQQPELPIEVHVIRIGDIAMATNPFELYLDYGIRMKARSPAVQTFIVQLAGNGTYLPTSRSVSGGAYGAVPASTLVGPKGGQELVEGTLELINSIWEKENK